LTCNECNITVTALPPKEKLLAAPPPIPDTPE
jgi:hypothetical protein